MAWHDGNIIMLKGAQIIICSFFHYLTKLKNVLHFHFDYDLNQF